MADPPVKWKSRLAESGWSGEHSDPHIFIDFGKDGPFAYVVAHLRKGGEFLREEQFSKYARQSIFQSTFPEPKRGATHEFQTFGFAEPVSMRLQHLSGPAILFAFDGKMKGVAEGDFVHVPAKDQRSSEKLLEITHVSSATVRAFVKGRDANAGYWRAQMKEHAGREIKASDRVAVFEAHSVIEMFQSKFLHYVESSY